jgi:hypothetical protein
LGVTQGKLILPNPMGKLNASDCDRGGLKGLESHHRRATSLDGSMILFHDVV